MKTNPIRVLHMIASLNIGGSQAMVMNLYRAVNKERVQFDFVIDHVTGFDLKEEIEKLGGRVFFLPVLNWKNYFEVKRAWELFFVKHPDYKILHTHSRSYASLYIPIAKKYGLTTIAHAHSTSNGKGIKAMMKNIMQYPIRYQVDYMFACSKEAGEWLFGKKAIKTDRFSIIPNSIDSKNFAFDTERRKQVRYELGIGEDFVVVGHVGRMAIPRVCSH